MARIARIALVAIYLIGMTVAIFLLDDYGNNGPGVEIWMGLSVLLGLGTGRPELAILAFLGILIAIPFGIPDDPESLSADPVFPLALAAAYSAMFSSALIFLTALARRKLEPRLQRRRRLRKFADS